MRLLKVVKEIKDKNGELVFRRYQLFTTPWFNCYLHEWHRADEDRHMHTHPWNFFGIILKGGYIEEVPIKGKEYTDKIRRGPGSIICGRNDYAHKVKRLLAPKGYTLFFTGKKTYSWGFLALDRIIPNEEYRQLKREGKL